MNPYAILGVARTATPDEIRGAYRARAKKLHPDAGGSPEAFAELASAHDILMNPHLRLVYDTTGKAEVPPPDQTLVRAYEAIFSIIEGVLENAEDPTVVPIMEVVRKGLAEQKRQVEETRAKVAESLRRTEATAKRFRRRSKGANMLQQMAENRALHLRAKIEEATPILERLAKAIEIAADYEFDKVTPPQPSAQDLMRTSIALEVQNSLARAMFGQRR